MQKSWHGLLIPPQIGDGGNKTLVERRNVFWKPPEVGWFKLNFTGDSHGNLGVLGVGYIVKD